MRLLSFLLLLTLPGVAGANELYWVDVSSPEPRDEVVSRVPFVRVSGQARRGAMRPVDVVLAIDLSESTFVASGRDVDGDGVVGRMRFASTQRMDGSQRPPRTWTTDRDDTLFETGRALARDLLASIPPDRVRVGLITFSDRVKVRARLGSPERALRALERLRPPLAPGGTDVARAIRVARSVLGSDDDGRAKLLLVVSDGKFTRPIPGAPADDAARLAAQRAARKGIEIHGLALGRSRGRDLRAFADLAEITRGVIASVDAPEVVLAALPIEGAPGLENVLISNATTGARGRAVRLFPDGTFDGYIELAPGRNQLAIRARADDGREVGAFRTVVFTPTDELSDADRARLEAMRLELRDRSLHIELAHEASASRGIVQSVEIEADE
jgi:hypothetical protein